MKRIPLICALAVLVAAASMSAFQALGAEPRITGTSHQHPEDQDYSFVCAKSAGKPGVYYKMRVKGPTYPSGMTKRFKMPDNGRKKTTFVIDVPGEYNFRFRRGDNTLDRASYTVPAPPPPEENEVGPFPC